MLRYVRPTLHLDPRLCWTVLLGGLPFFVWQAALLIYGQIDTVMLSFLASDAVVGWYAAAYRIVMIPVFMPTIIVTVIFPALSAATGDSKTFNGIARRAVHAAGIDDPDGTRDHAPARQDHPGSVSESFSHSALPLMLLAPTRRVAAIDVMIGSILNTRDRQRQWALTAVAALPQSTARTWSPSRCPSRCWVTAPAPRRSRRDRSIHDGRRTAPDAARHPGTAPAQRHQAMLAGVAMAAWSLLTRELPIFVAVLGAIVYCGACLVLGAVQWASSTRRLHLVQRRARAASHELAMARVSVIVTCYKYARFVGRGSRQLAWPDLSGAQHRRRRCLADNSRAVLLARYADSPRVRLVLHDQNQGHIRSYNEACGMRGEFVGVLAADDFCLRTDAVARQVAIFDAHPRVGFVLRRSRWSTSTALGSATSSRGRVTMCATASTSSANWSFATTCRIRARSCADGIAALGVYDEALPHAGDWDLGCVAARFDVGYVAERYAYRVHGTNMSIARHSAVALERRGPAGRPARRPPTARCLPNCTPRAARATHQARMNTTWGDRSLGRVRRA
jgi:hypothetical protein